MVPRVRSGKIPPPPRMIRTFINSHTSEKCRLGIKDSDLIPVGINRRPVGRDHGVDGDQSVWARRNRDNAVAGEIAHGVD